MEYIKIYNLKINIKFNTNYCVLGTIEFPID